MKRPDSLNRKLLQLEAREEALRYSLMIGGVSYDRDRVQVSPTDKMAEVFSKIDDIQRRRKEIAIEYKQATDDIVEAVNKWLGPGSPEATVIILSYVGKQPMKKIAEKLYYSCSHCYYLRDRGEVLMSQMQKATAGVQNCEQQKGA